nr:hypothetical protein [Sandaracinus amylolyticus]
MLPIDAAKSDRSAATWTGWLKNEACAPVSAARRSTRASACPAASHEATSSRSVPSTTSVGALVATS